MFSGIYRDRLWGDDTETLSGSGSTIENSQIVQQALPGLMRKLGAHSLLEAGCDDFNWMRLVTLPGVEYIGADTVAEVIRNNQQKYSEGRSFIVADITKDRVPRADVVLCRHCFIHLPNEQADAVGD